MLTISEMAELLGCSESRLLRNTKEYIQKINTLGYEKVGRGKKMMFGEIQTSVEKEEYIKLLDILEGNDILLNNLLDVIEEVVEMDGLNQKVNENNKKYIQSDIEVLAERLNWSESKVKQYIKALQDAKILKKINPKYFGIEYNGEWKEISEELYNQITEQINTAISKSNDPQYMRELVLAVHNFKNIRKLHGWTFTDEVLDCPQFLTSLMLAMEYRKEMKKKNNKKN